MELAEMVKPIPVIPPEGSRRFATLCPSRPGDIHYRASTRTISLTPGRVGLLAHDLRALQKNKNQYEKKMRKRLEQGTWAR
jgi:hypothetical protein